MDWSTYWTILIQILVGIVFAVMGAAIFVSAFGELRKIWHRKSVESGHDDGRP